MHQLLASSGIALLITAVLSIAVGWLIAGRVLRPLRTITAAAQHISTRTCTSGSPSPARRRAQAARGHHRRAARPPRGGFRRPAPLRRQRLARAAHPARHDARLAGRGHRANPARRAGVTVLSPTRSEPGSTRPTGWWRASSPSPAPSTAAPYDRARSRWTSSPPRCSTEHGRRDRDMHLTVGQDLDDARGAPAAETLLTRMVDNVIDNAIRTTSPAAGSASPPAPGTDTRGSSSRTAARSSTRTRSASWPSRSGARCRADRLRRHRRRARALDRRRDRRRPPRHASTSHARPTAGCASPSRSRSPPARRSDRRSVP